jgi:tRNA pseudouridine55 synthase
MATGLLVVFVGRATRAVEFAEADEKAYLAVLRLGVETDTQDITGRVLHTCGQAVSTEELEAALDRFRGEIQQIPPMYSAIKVNGKKLYEIARKGGEVERAPRQVSISQLELLGMEDGAYRLSVVCSKGTYIRTLCHDIGHALGVGGTMSSLRRVRAGAFSVEDAVTLEQVQRAADAGTVEQLLLPVDTLFAQYDAIKINAKAAAQVKNGGTVSADAPDGTYRIYGESGEFLSLGRVTQGNCKTIKSFFEV